MFYFLQHFNTIYLGGNHVKAIGAKYIAEALRYNTVFIIMFYLFHNNSNLSK